MNNGGWYVIKKGGKYMTGHGYSTYLGYKWSWSKDISKARRFRGKERAVWATQSGGVIVPSTIKD